MLLTFFARVIAGVELLHQLDRRQELPDGIHRSDCACELQKVASSLGADSQRRIETNPLRVLDSEIAGGAADH